MIKLKTARLIRFQFTGKLCVPALTKEHLDFLRVNCEVDNFEREYAAAMEKNVWSWLTGCDITLYGLLSMLIKHVEPAPLINQTVQISDHSIGIE